MGLSRAEDIEVFLDETPGETRGVIVRNGLYDTLLIHRDSDAPAQRLGARSIGRVSDVDRSLNAAFVDLGGEGPLAFLTLGKAQAVRQGQAVEVVVSAEARERKGAALRLIGEGEGTPRLLTSGPSIAETLQALAPGAEIETGAPAIRAALEAEEEALSDGGFYPEIGLDLAVQRTRALIAVDIDYAGTPGQDGRKGRAAANRQGLMHAARLIRLKAWGGLVAIDLVGAGHDTNRISEEAKAAFGAHPDIAYGPLNRFGVLQLSLPWRRTPVDERLNNWNGRRTPEAGALDAIRRLRLALLSDTAAPRFIARCHPGEVALAASLASRLGPRAAVIADPSVQPGQAQISET